MYRAPPARAWWPAVGAPLKRGVRPHRDGTAVDEPTDREQRDAYGEDHEQLFRERFFIVVHCQVPH